MSEEKKYLLTLKEAEKAAFLAPYAATEKDAAEWLEAHEYHERTAHLDDDGCCTACGASNTANEYAFGYPFFCHRCGAEVVDG